MWGKAGYCTAACARHDGLCGGPGGGVLDSRDLWPWRGPPDVDSVYRISAAGTHVSPTDPFLAHRDKTVHEYGVSRETESSLGPGSMPGVGADGPSGRYHSATGGSEQDVPQPRIGNGYGAQGSTGQVYG